MINLSITLQFKNVGEMESYLRRNEEFDDHAIKMLKDIGNVTINNITYRWGDAQVVNS